MMTIVDFGRFDQAGGCKQRKTTFSLRSGDQGKPGEPGHRNIGSLLLIDIILRTARTGGVKRGPLSL